MNKTVQIPNEINEKLNLIKGKFESKFDLNDEEISYVSGEIGFGYKYEKRDFEIVFNVFRKNFVIVIDFWKENQQRIDIQYEEENEAWYVYSHAVNWVEELEEIMPLEESFLDDIIDGFFDSIKK